MPSRIEAALFFYFKEVLMKKYKILKWLVLFVAVGSLLCFFIPFTSSRLSSNDWSKYIWLDDRNRFENPFYGIYFFESQASRGVDFVFGKAEFSNSVFTAAIWLSRVSFVVALVAIVFAVLPLVIKDANGLNKQGKFHKSIIISSGLAFLSALINFIIIQAGSAIECAVEVEVFNWNGMRNEFVGYDVFHYVTFFKHYTWIGLLIIGVLLIPVAILSVLSLREKISIDFCGYLEGPMTPNGKCSICISQGACLAWSAGNADIVLSKETVKSVESANKTVSDVVDGKRVNFDVYNITMADGQEGTLSLLQAHAGSVVRAMSDLVVVPKSAAPRGEIAKYGKTTVSTGEPDSPNGKPLDWFKSEKGLEVYKAYITPQNYFLQETYLKEYKKMFEGEDTNVDFDRHFLPCSYPNAKLPRTYFNALLESIGTEPLYNGAILELFRGALLVIAKPYVINEDGEPELRDTILTPEQIVSTDENPLLYFIKNFNAFEMKDEATGSLIDKYFVYKAVVLFILNFVNEIVIEENKWLFDKNTYLNDLGIVRKIKGFIKKCKELTDNERYNKQLDVILDILLSEMESSAQHRREDEGNRVLRQQAEEQRRYNEEQRRFNEQQAEEQRKQAEEQKKLMQKQMDEQKKAAQRQACAAGQCPRCRRQCGMVNFHSNGSGGCTWFQSK